MLFGVNENRFADTEPYVEYPLGFSIIRCYNGIATTDRTWPVMPVEGCPSLWSPRPKPTDLFAGKYDAAFAAVLADAPPGSMLSTWHEAELVGGSMDYKTAQKVHEYMYALVHKHSTTIPYGIVTSQGATSHWDVPGMDFYGGDTYDWRKADTFDNAWNYWSASRPAGPRVIAETNSPVPANRPSWFKGSYNWLLQNNGLAMCTFWNPGGGDSGPFLPDDTATIEALNEIGYAAMTNASVS